eukprot:COSAG02_NODE_245_length_27293_cov_16.488012_6_plen_34_part_00
MLDLVPEYSVYGPGGYLYQGYSNTYSEFMFFKK